MDPTTYLLACFTMTVLWTMAVLGAIAMIVGVGARLIHGDGLTLSQRRLCWHAFTCGLVGFVAALPCMQTLYVFWGHW